MQLTVRSLLSLILAATFLLHTAAGEEVRVSNRDELVSALREARPGTTILIAAGEYRGGLGHAQLREQGAADCYCWRRSAESAGHRRGRQRSASDFARAC